MFNSHFEEHSLFWILVRSGPAEVLVWIPVFRKVDRRPEIPKSATFPTPTWWRSSCPPCRRRVKSPPRCSSRKQQIQPRFSSREGQWIRRDSRRTDLPIFGGSNLGFGIPIAASARRMVSVRSDLRRSKVSVTLRRWFDLKLRLRKNYETKKFWLLKIVFSDIFSEIDVSNLQ